MKMDGKPKKTVTKPKIWKKQQIELSAQHLTETKQEIELLQAELQRLLDQNVKKDVVEKEENKEKGNSDSSVENIPPKIENVRVVSPAIKRKTLQPVTLSSKEPTPKKVKHYDKQMAREYIKKQKLLRKEKQKEQQQTLNPLDLKKQRLKELEQKTRQLVSQNVKKTARRSLVLEKKTPIKITERRSRSAIRECDKNAQNVYKLTRNSTESSIQSKKRSRSISQDRIGHKKITESLNKAALALLNDQIQMQTNKKPLVIKKNLSETETKTSNIHKPIETPLEMDKMSLKQNQVPNNEKNSHKSSQFSPKRLKEPIVALENYFVVCQRIKAATIIQKHWKGYKQRKKYKNDIETQRNLKHNTVNVVENEKKAIPVWLQPPATLPYPYNFLSSVKKKLSLVSLKHQPETVDVGVQMSEKEVRNVKNILKSKIPDFITYNSHENVNNELKLKAPLITVPRSDEKSSSGSINGNKSSKNKTEIVEVVLSSNNFDSESDSDTTKNIPEISEESRTSLPSSLFKNINFDRRKSKTKLEQNADFIKNITFDRLNNERSLSPPNFHLDTRISQSEVSKYPSDIEPPNFHLDTKISQSEVSKYSSDIEPPNLHLNTKISQTEASKYPSDIESILSHYSKNSRLANASPIKTETSIKTITNDKTSQISKSNTELGNIDHSKSYKENLTDSEIKTLRSKPLRLDNKFTEIRPAHEIFQIDSTHNVKSSSQLESLIETSRKIINDSEIVASKIAAKKAERNKSTTEIDTILTNRSDATNRSYTSEFVSDVESKNISIVKSISVVSVNEEINTDTDDKNSVTSQSFIVEESYVKTGKIVSEEIPHLVKPSATLKAKHFIEMDKNTSKNKSNHLHLKFEAELHLLNSFNNSLQQVVEVEKSLLGMEQNQNIIKENNNFELGLKAPQVSLSAPDLLQTPHTDHESHKKHSHINYKRGNDFDDGLDLMNAGRSAPNLNTMELEPMKNTTYTTTVNSIVTKLANETSVFTNNKPTVNGPLSLALFDSMITEEDHRIELLKAVLKIREKTLLDRTRGELAWLEIQKQQFINSGLTEKLSNVKKKQRGLLIKYQQERHEMQRLKKAHKKTAEERKMALNEQKRLMTLQLAHSTDDMPIKLKKTPRSERRQSGPFKVYSIHTKTEHKAETQMSKRNSAVEEIISITSSSFVSKISGESDVESVRESVKEILPAQNMHLDKVKKSLLLREEALQKRRREAEELLQWHERLKEEEMKILQLEQQAADSVPRNIPEKNNVITGAQLNRFWKNITGMNIKKFDDKKKFSMSQKDLEQFFLEARKIFHEISDDNSETRRKSSFTDYVSDFEIASSIKTLDNVLDSVSSEFVNQNYSDSDRSRKTIVSDVEVKNSAASKENDSITQQYSPEIHESLDKSKTLVELNKSISENLMKIIKSEITKITESQNTSDNIIEKTNTILTEEQTETQIESEIITPEEILSTQSNNNTVNTSKPTISSEEINTSSLKTPEQSDIKFIGIISETNNIPSLKSVVSDHIPKIVSELSNLTSKTDDNVSEHIASVKLDSDYSEIKESIVEISNKIESYSEDLTTNSDIPKEEESFDQSDIKEFIKEVSELNIKQSSEKSESITVSNQIKDDENMTVDEPDLEFKIKIFDDEPSSLKSISAIKTNSSSYVKRSRSQRESLFSDNYDSIREISEKLHTNTTNASKILSDVKSGSIDTNLEMKSSEIMIEAISDEINNESDTDTKIKSLISNDTNSPVQLDSFISKESINTAVNKSSTLSDIQEQTENSRLNDIEDDLDFETTVSTSKQKNSDEADFELYISDKISENTSKDIKSDMEIPIQSEILPETDSKTARTLRSVESLLSNDASRSDNPKSILESTKYNKIPSYHKKETSNEHENDTLASVSLDNDNSEASDIISTSFSHGKSINLSNDYDIKNVEINISDSNMLEISVKINMDISDDTSEDIRSVSREMKGVENSVMDDKSSKISTDNIEKEIIAIVTNEEENPEEKTSTTIKYMKEYSSDLKSSEFESSEDIIKFETHESTIKTNGEIPQTTVEKTKIHILSNKEHDLVDITTTLSPKSPEDKLSNKSQNDEDYNSEFDIDIESPGPKSDKSSNLDLNLKDLQNESSTNTISSNIDECLETVKESPESRSSSNREELNTIGGVSHIDVRKRVSEILADTSGNVVSRGDKSPRMQDYYVTTYDVMSPSPGNSPEIGSPTEDLDLKEKDALIRKSIYGSEAEELRRKQLEIEQEIKRIEQQQKENVPYCFMREIPNKPPPPYKPPVIAPQVTTVIPTDVRQVKTFVKKSSELLYKDYAQEKLTEKSSANIGEKINSYRFIFDICKEIALEIQKQMKPDNFGPSWMQLKQRFKPPEYTKQITQDSLETLLNRKVQQLLGFQQIIRKDNLIVRWSRKKRDHVDEILVLEAQAEEAEWTNYDKDALTVKDSLTNDIFDMLVSDTAQTMANILKKKKSTRNNCSDM